MADKTLKLPCDVLDVSDGFHTFRELYEHRYALFLALCAMVKAPAFKSRLNKDGSAWDGWFVAWIETKFGMISYHLPDRFWDSFVAIEKPTCDTYDGHTADDAVKRLLAVARSGSL